MEIAPFEELAIKGDGKKDLLSLISNLICFVMPQTSVFQTPINILGRERGWRDFGPKTPTIET